MKTLSVKSYVKPVNQACQTPHVATSIKHNAMAKVPETLNVGDVELLAEGSQIVVCFEGFAEAHRGIVKEVAKGARRELIVTSLFEDGTVVACTVDKYGQLWETPDKDRNLLAWYAQDVPSDDLFAGSMWNADGTKKSLTQLADSEEKNEPKKRNRGSGQDAAAAAAEKKKKKMQSVLKNLAVPGSVGEAERVKVVSDVLRGDV